VAAPRFCPGHGTASAANIIMKVEIRRNFDIDIFMAARF
jgi:hypothetical protein